MHYGKRFLRYRYGRTLLCVFFTALFVLAASTSLVSSEDNSNWINFTILHTNDEHSALIPHSPAIDHDPLNPDDPTIGGFARLATVIEQIRTEKAQTGEPVLLLNGGDFLGGSAFGWLAPAGYAAELAVMQSLGYDAVTIGNHEYDYTPDVLADYLIAAGYPQAHETMVVLASNTLPPEEHPLATEGLFRETAVIELENGLKVGFFGMIGEDAESVSSDTGDVLFLDRHDTARKMVERLRQDQVDIIIALTHSGVDEDKALAKDVEGIDVIVGGHCHSSLHQPVTEGTTIIVQAGSLVKYLGRIELAYNRDSGEIRIRNDADTPFLIPIDGSIQPQTETAILIEQYTNILNDLVKEMTDGLVDDILAPVITSDFPISHRPSLQESPVGNFITDAMRLITEEVTGERVDVAIMGNGNIRGTMYPGTMPHSEGIIPFYEIVEVIGLGHGQDGYAGYPIVSLYLTGDELARLLEVAVLLKELMGNTYFLQFSGLRFDYNPKNAVLFTVPIMNQPLPSTRAVTRAELYTGEGVQPAEGDKGYVPIRRGDQQLYHLVTDSMNLSFLPLVGRILPSLDLVPKHADGTPIDLTNPDEYTVKCNGMELKVWHAVVEYAAAQPKGKNGIPQMPDYYEKKAGRINEIEAISYMTAGLLALGGLVALGVVTTIVASFFIVK